VIVEIAEIVDTAETVEMSLTQVKVAAQAPQAVIRQICFEPTTRAMTGQKHFRTHTP